MVQDFFYKKKTSKLQPFLNMMFKLYYKNKGGWELKIEN